MLGCILYTGQLEYKYIVLECLVVYCTPDTSNISILYSNAWLYIVHRTTRILICKLYTGQLECMFLYCIPDISNIRLLQSTIFGEQKCKETQEVINSCKMK